MCLRVPGHRSGKVKRIVSSQKRCILVGCGKVFTGRARNNLSWSLGRDLCGEDYVLRDIVMRNLLVGYYRMHVLRLVFISSGSAGQF